MIKSLELQNFRSHRRTLFEFVPGVNIIVGLSDSGKTDIVRAMRWIKDNRPSGPSMISWDSVRMEGDTFARITTDTGDIITRSKGKVEEYKVNKLELHAFKTDVPAEVTQALNMNAINVKTQFESHFLLSSTPGEVASHFNRVARLDKIDQGTANINKWIKEIQTKIEYDNEQIKTETEKLKQFEHLARFETDIETLEALEATRTQTQLKYDKLKAAQRRINEIDEDLLEYSGVIAAEPLLLVILQLTQERSQINAKLVKLRSLKNELSNNQTEIDDCADLLAMEPLVANLLKLKEIRAAAQTRFNKLLQLKNNIQDTDTRLIRSEQRLKDLQKQFADEFPEICPLCGKPK